MKELNKIRHEIEGYSDVKDLPSTGCFLTSLDFEVLARLAIGSTDLVVTSGIVRFRGFGLVGGESSITGCFRAARFVGGITSGFFFVSFFGGTGFSFCAAFRG